MAERGSSDDEEAAYRRATERNEDYWDRVSPGLPSADDLRFAEMLHYYDSQESEVTAREGSEHQPDHTQHVPQLEPDDREVWLKPHPIDARLSLEQAYERYEGPLGWKEWLAGRAGHEASVARVYSEVDRDAAPSNAGAEPGRSVDGGWEASDTRLDQTSGREIAPEPSDAGSTSSSQAIHERRRHATTTVHRRIVAR